MKRKRAENNRQVSSLTPLLPRLSSFSMSSFTNPSIPSSGSILCPKPAEKYYPQGEQSKDVNETAWSGATQTHVRYSRTRQDMCIVISSLVISSPAAFPLASVRPQNTQIESIARASRELELVFTVKKVGGRAGQSTSIAAFQNDWPPPQFIHGRVAKVQYTDFRRKTDTGFRVRSMKYQYSV